MLFLAYIHSGICNLFTIYFLLIKRKKEMSFDVQLWNAYAPQQQTVVQNKPGAAVNN